LEGGGERKVKARYVTWSEARRLLKSRIEEEMGLPLPMQTTWDYLREFGDKDPDAAAETVEKLVGLGLDEEVAVNLANICPEVPGEVRSILAMRKELKYDEELVRKILEVLEPYCSTQYPEE